MNLDQTRELLKAALTPYYRNVLDRFEAQVREDTLNADPDAPLHTDEEYVEYGSVQYRRGSAQAKYEAEHPK